MIRANVVGRLWASKKLEEIPAGSLVEVVAEAGGGRIVAFDPLSCGEGEQVLVVTGSVAAAWFKKQSPPIDALVIARVDEAASGANPKTK